MRTIFGGFTIIDPTSEESRGPVEVACGEIDLDDIINRYNYPGFNANDGPHRLLKYALTEDTLRYLEMLFATEIDALDYVRDMIDVVETNKKRKGIGAHAGEPPEEKHR